MAAPLAVCEAATRPRSGTLPSRYRQSQGLRTAPIADGGWAVSEGGQPPFGRKRSPADKLFELSSRFAGQLGLAPMIAPAVLQVSARQSFHGDGLSQIARVVDVATLLQRHVIGEELQRNVQKQWIKLWLGRWHFKRCIDLHRKLP
jgi:hypothetical protein